MSKKTKIVFASCIRHEVHPKQTEWKYIEEEIAPDYLFLLGDQIYMDFGLIGKERNGAPKDYSLEKFRRVMNEKYERQWTEPNFNSLFHKMKERDAVFGIWDDHDFAWDNAVGKHVPEDKKNASRELFHKWMNCSRNRPEVYFHVDLPHARAIFLDNRFYADVKGPDNDLLGPEQYRFLKEALQHDRLYTIICAGLTLTGGPKIAFIDWKAIERWELYTRDYKDFCDLVKTKQRVLFLGGDVHRNAFYPPEDGERPCYEIISSGFGVNNLGLNVGGLIPADECRNWGLLELDEHEVCVTLIEKEKPTRYRIDAATWGYQQL
jgi:phosphodiesterase/alkaline phosphatase D-like protein